MARTPGKGRIAWFSPGAATASDYVTARLLPLLREEFEIVLFLGQEPSSASQGMMPCHSFEQALRRHFEKPFDIFFYQVEDEPASMPVFLHSLLMPGIILYHDVLLRPGRLQRVEEFNPKLENDRRRRLQILLPGGEAAAFDPAFIALFSSERNLGEYERLRRRPIGSGLGWAPSMFYLPYPAELRPRTASRPDASERRCLDVCFCGSPLLEYRSHKLLAGLAAAGGRHRLVWLLNDEERKAAEKLCAECGVDGVEFSSPRTFDSWSGICSRCSAAAHFICSAYGDPGPWLPLSMSAGCFCLVSDFSGSALLPDGIVTKIPCGAGEGEAVARALDDLSRLSPQAEQAARDRVQSYAGENYSSKGAAADLSYIFRRFGPQIAAETGRWFEFLRADNAVDCLGAVSKKPPWDKSC